ncbi:MAG: hypothetical protein LQ341_006324 [Variospora aurantia]|nr:MAG: hypothetical protein LQ341_006324 [Variospora aurantia]
MESLSSKTSIKAVKKAIANLPNRLNQLYDEAFERIDGQNEDDRELAHRALRWVAYAYRPLTVEELEEALAIDPEADDLDREASPPISLVLDACAGLLITDEETATVRLVHYTAQDYFDSLTLSKLQDDHTALARECIAYLSGESIQSCPNESPVDSLDYPLLAYASYCWAQHAKAGREAGLAAEIDAYLLKDPRVWLPDSRSGDQYGEWNKCKGYAIAAHFGLCNPLRRVLAQTNDINVLPYEGRSALHLAAANNQAAAIKILLEHGSDIECMDDIKATPLLVAAKTSSKAAFELLVNEGANLLAMDKFGNVPFTTVNWDSPIPILQQLLDRGADIDDVSGGYGTCLMKQAERGDAQTVHWLLEKGASANIQDHYLETALHKASYHGLVDVVDLLLSHGADANISDRNGHSALHVACEEIRWNVISRLLDHGVDLNDQDDEGRTALHAAAWNHDPQCLILLLAHGADVEKQYRNGESPLFVAAQSDSPHGISALLKAGADVNKQNNNGETALMQAIRYDSIRAFSALLEAGADIDKQNTSGETALMIAALKDSIHALSALLGAGADIEKQDLGGLTALHYAAGEFNSETIQLLLDSNVAPAVRSNPTLTVRSPTSWSLDDSLELYLLASVRFQNEVSSFQTLLFVTQRVRVMSLRLLLHLLSSAAGECRVWKSGMTALDIAVLRGNEACIRTLSNASSVSRTESEAMPLVEYVYNVCGASTMEELKEKWEQWTEEELEARRRYFGSDDSSEDDESGEEDEFGAEDGSGEGIDSV